MEGTTTAIIYIPPGITDDGPAATNCLTHLHRRRYRFYAMFRDLDLVDWALEGGHASTVVVARPDHLERDLPVPVEVVGEITRRLAYASAEEPPDRPRLPRLNLRSLLIALMVATTGAALMWIGLQNTQLGMVEVPLYILVGLVVGAWIPMAGAGINAAWASDINTALAWASAWAYRDGYSDGFVDCATMDDR